MDNLIVGLLTQTDQLVQDFVFNAYAALVSALAEPLALSITLSIALLGLSISQGWVKLSGGLLNKYILGLGFVYVFATSWTVFDSMVYHGLTNGPMEIANALINALHLPFDGGVNQALQHSYDSMIAVSDNIWSVSGYKSKIFSVAFLIVGLALFGFALFEFMMAKICLGILLALAPFFIPLYLFKATQPIFERWMGYAIGFAMVPIFVTTALVFVLYFLNNDLASLLSGKLNTSAVVGFFLIALVSIGLLYEAGVMAKNIGGGVSAGGGLAAVATGLGAAAGAYAGAKSIYSGKQAVGKVMGYIGKIGSHESTVRF